MLDRCPRNVPTCLVESPSWQCRHQLELGEASTRGLSLAVLQDQSAQPSPRMVRVDEERADLCRVGPWIEPRVVAIRASVASEQRPAPAPPTAADDLATLGDHDEVGPIADQGGVDPERPRQRGFDLFRRVIVGTEFADRTSNQLKQCGLVRARRQPQSIVDASTGIHSLAVAAWSRAPSCRWLSFCGRSCWQLPSGLPPSRRPASAQLPSWLAPSRHVPSPGAASARTRG